MSRDKSPSHTSNKTSRTPLLTQPTRNCQQCPSVNFASKSTPTSVGCTACPPPASLRSAGGLSHRYPACRRWGRIYILIAYSKQTKDSANN